MFPGATLFLDVCVQRWVWPGGAWPLVDLGTERSIERMLVVAEGSPVRRGSIRCRHGTDGNTAIMGSPPHAEDARGSERPDGFPLAEGAYVVDSGCGLAPDEGAHVDVFSRMTAGVRDAVLFGAGVEHGIAQAARALLRRRIRTHLVLDAATAADDVEAQLVVADLKRRGLDVLTVDVVARCLAGR